MGVPLVITHFRSGFSRSQKPSSDKGVPFWESPYYSIINHFSGIFHRKTIHLFGIFHQTLEAQLPFFATSLNLRRLARQGLPDVAHQPGEVALGTWAGWKCLVNKMMTWLFNMGFLTWGTSTLKSNMLIVFSTKNHPAIGVPP